MGYKRFVWLGLACMLLAVRAWGDRVVLRIRAANPLDTPQTVEIRSNLPARVSTNDIVNLSGLALRYDIKTDSYYVFRELTLGPREVVSFDVEIRDIWVLDEADLEAYRAHAVQLADKLSGTDYADTAMDLKAEIERNLEAVRQLQAANRIGPGVRPIQHIRAYEANLETLQRVKTDIGYIENLVLGTGQDVGRLLGEVKQAPDPKRDLALPDEDYRTALLRISVRNTSPREVRRVTVERELPAEIKIHDVLDAGELEVGSRPGSGITYVYLSGVEIPPNETRVFEVTLRDKWNLTAVRLPALRKRAEDVQAMLGESERFASIEAALVTVLEDLAVIEAEVGPRELGDAYVAFYREQGERLNGIERRIARIETAMRPQADGTRYGFTFKAPTMKTTWLIIYGILGFVGLMALLFFLRWYGHGK